MTLKIIYSRNAAKNLSHLTNFPANNFLFGFRKNICTASFLDAQELHSWSTLKANVCIFLYIPVRKFLFLRFYLVWRGRMISLRAVRCLSLVKCFTIFHFNWHFRNSTIFSNSILPSIALKCWNFPYSFDLWLNFSYEVTFSQYKTKWQQNNKVNMGPFIKYVTWIMAFFTPFSFVTLGQLNSITSPVSFTKLH